MEEVEPELADVHRRERRHCREATGKPHAILSRSSDDMGSQYNDRLGSIRSLKNRHSVLERWSNHGWTVGRLFLRK